jgi:capsular polysaccharide biosynthesis protein
MIEIIEPIHNINIKTMGSFLDFVPGPSPENSKFLNFLENDITYVFIWNSANYHHFFINIFMPAITVINERQDKNLHFVLYSNNTRHKSENYDNLLVELLEEKKINYTKIQNNEYEYINSKNFIPINSSSLEYGIPEVYNYFINKYNITEEKPNKKIYISRKKINSVENRIDDEESLEVFFIKNGFKIVYPEEILTFKEQFKLFNSCSVLAGITGSGLTNLLFMQQHQIVIEIITKLDIGFSDKVTGVSGVRQEIHEHYNEFCKIKNLTRVGVFNMNKNSPSVQTNLKNLVESFDTKL